MHKGSVSRAVFFVAIAAAINDASALGFGRLRSAAVLGQPLQLMVAVRVDDGESLEPGCVTADVWSGEQHLPPSAVRVQLEGEGGERQVHVSTTVPIDEPIVTVTVAAGCPARLSQRFVAFADPPPAMAQPPAAEPAAIASAPAAPPTAPARAAARPPRRSATLSPSVAASAGARRPDRPRRAAALASRAAPSAPRLRLEEAEIAPVSTDAAAAAAAQAQASAAQQAASSAEASASAANQRLLALEAELAALRKEAQANRDAMLQMRARLAQDDFASRLLPWLAAAVAVLALLAGWLALRVRRLAQARNHEAWYGGGAAESTHLRDSVLDSEAAPLSGRTTEQAVFDMAAHAPPPEPPAAAEPPPVAPAPVPLAPVRRDVTVEEQIDLEQQADFFIVLGQDEAATDLLLTHLRGTGGTSPMPYLKLLDLYRRRNDRDAYERTRVRFNQRFNGVAPDWDTDLNAGRSLEGYPQVMARLQHAWWSPLDAMAELESMLFRKGVDAELFDLPAYQEVMFLYQLARDLHEHERGRQQVPDTAVDVLLPITDADGSGMSVRHVDMNTAQVLHPRAEKTEIALDIDLTQPAPLEEDEAPPRENELRLTSDFLSLDDETPDKPR